MQDYSKAIDTLRPKDGREDVPLTGNAKIQDAWLQSEILVGCLLGAVTGFGVVLCPRLDMSLSPKEGDGLGMNPLILNFRGNALAQLGRYDEAVENYQEATQIFDADGEVPYESPLVEREAVLHHPASSNAFRIPISWKILNVQTF